MSQVIFWIEAQSTIKEIAGSFGVSADTLKKAIKKYFGTTFQDLYEKHSATGIMSLRRNQFKLAKTNPSMAIWLGKQYLGQHDPDNRIKTCPNDNKLSKLFSLIKTTDVE